MSDIKEYLAEKSSDINNYLKSWLNSTNTPKRLKKAMLYSLDAGGKRLRPVLCLAWANIGGLNSSIILPFATAIEMIHTYSLIHDDLPAMDDDDLRRGRPSCHKAFDEATAILAGDGLLTDAFYVALNTKVSSPLLIRALSTLLFAAGSAGMVGGQMLDIAYTNENNISICHLEQMQSMKTGALITASCVCGAILSESNSNFIESAKIYGHSLGKAFQIMDDILDITQDTETLGKPAGSDLENSKVTWPSLVGIEASFKEAEAQIKIAKKSVPKMDNNDTIDFLYELPDFIIHRKA